LPSVALLLSPKSKMRSQLALPFQLTQASIVALLRTEISALGRSTY
jgi:hypothetical protein